MIRLGESKSISPTRGGTAATRSNIRATGHCNMGWQVYEKLGSARVARTLSEKLKGYEQKSGGVRKSGRQTLATQETRIKCPNCTNRDDWSSLCHWDVPFIRDSTDA